MTRNARKSEKSCFESAACFDVIEETSDILIGTEALISRYKDPGYACSKHIQSKDDLDALMSADYLRREMQIRMNSRAAFQNASPAPGVNHAPLFGYQDGITLPAIPQHPTGTVIHDQQEQTTVQAIMPITESNIPERMWFETRSLTGGSRNILDLSKLGTIIQGTAAGTRYETDKPSRILGNIAFFDIDPEAINAEKSVTINYEGTDYMDCTIKYPEGDRSNGSWRIQLKGQSASGQKIQTIEGDAWLQYKILIFEKIRTDYYGLSVVGTELMPLLEEQSQVVATNGSSRNSKKFGLLL